MYVKRDWRGDIGTYGGSTWQDIGDVNEKGLEGRYWDLQGRMWQDIGDVREKGLEG